MSSATESYLVPSTLNADFGQRVIVRTNDLPWLPSPQAGVERRLLDRVGAEVARATSIVRYAADSHFPPHEHGAGEEFLVLDGTFCDEHAEYPAGTYVRNPPGSYHAPFTDEGCVIFVKLRQMRSSGEPHIVCNSSAENWLGTGSAGVEEVLLYDAGNGRERVSLERLAANTPLPVNARNGGYELLLLEGAIADDSQQLEPGAWVRAPHGDQHAWLSTTDCTYWIKRGHLHP